MAQNSKIWTTEEVNRTLEKLRFAPDEVNLDCFHQRDPELKGENVLFQLTPEEEQEFIKCSQDIEYFVETYCQFLTDKGRTTVDLRDFQRDILNTIGEEEWIPNIQDFGPKVRNYILMASRQTGKTTTISSFFAWYLCFHTDRNMLILANKQTTTTEIVSKVINVFRGLPFFLKPGIRQIGVLGFKLDNGCMLVSQATTKTAAIGFTIHVLYIDEFAHINQKTARSFWRSVYPTLSSSLISQCIITSTPDGMDNLFFEIWDKAVKKKNSFTYKRVDYWEVPGHDDKWAEKMKEDFGEEEFAQEFELSFDRKSNLLLSGTDLSWMKKLERKYKYHELEKSDLDESLYRDKLKWHPGFDPNEDFDPKLTRIILSNDIAEGKDEEEDKDNDYNITTIWKVEPKSYIKIKKLRKDERVIKNLFRIRQIGIFRDNIGDEDIMAKVNTAIAFDQFKPDLIKWVTEMNFNGKAFLGKVSEHDDYSEDQVMHSYHTAPVPGEKPPRKKAGFKVSSNKEYFCKLGKKLISQRTIIPNEKETIAEFGSFGKVGTTWKGIAKHDDIAMSVLNISRFYEEPEYSDWLYDFLEEMPDVPLKNYMLRILQEDPTGDTDISDEGFSYMYNDSDFSTSEQDEIRKIWNAHEKGGGRYPGIGTPWKGNNLPWKS